MTFRVRERNLVLIAVLMACGCTTVTTQSFRATGNTNVEASYIATDADFGRYSRMIGDGTLAGAKSASNSRAALLLGAGLRVDAQDLTSRWGLRIQLGIAARSPFAGVDLQIGALPMPSQQAALNLFLGMTFDFS